MNEQEILNLCKDTYKQLRLRLQNIAEDMPLRDKIKLLFDTVDGKAHINQSSPRYASYDGYVDSYTIAGSISADYAAGDFNRLIEDLTMAIYRNNGGTQINYTPNLIKQLQ